MNGAIKKTGDFSPLNPQLPQHPRDIVTWGGLPGCGDSLCLAQAIRSSAGFYLVVTADMQTTLRLERELRFFLDDNWPVMNFPDWETLPYDVFSPLPEIVSQRIRTLVQLPEVQRGVLVVTAATLMQKLAPRTHIVANSFNLRKGGRLSIDETRLRLESVGYQCVSQVLQHGEFAIRVTT